MSDIEARVKKIIAEQLGVPESDVTHEKAFVADLGADSLDTVELVMALEDERPDTRARMSRRRVVVTGVGLISPVGITVAEGWANLLAGRSGIAPISRFDASGLSCRFAGEVKGFKIEDYIPAKEARHMDTFIHYGMAAAIQAVQDSGLAHGDALTEAQAERIGCIVGSGIGGLPLIEATQVEYAARGARRISPFFVPASIINMISGHISIHYGFKGPNLAVVTACTTGLHCIGEAGRLIEYGDADVMVAGGAESTVSPLGVGGFAAARALSSRNDDPTTASRPWDKDRDGFVLGEGSGCLVLEEYEHARKRGARIYAELVGFGMGADAFHMTAPSIGQVSKDVAEAIGLSKAAGALVQGVASGEPADKAGIEAGDVILKVDGKAVERSGDLPRMIGATKPGSRVTLNLWRRGVARDVVVTVAEFEPDRAAQAIRPEPKASAPMPKNAIGLAVSELTDVQRKELRLKSGVKVDAVEGAAARAGLPLEEGERDHRPGRLDAAASARCPLARALAGRAAG
ncbi:hypothetical protein B566_EDAN018802 [Ephemera danica]|nr:hypothetical protein B566_EDAN018802 [Ephemera danica]